VTEAEVVAVVWKEVVGAQHILMENLAGVTDRVTREMRGDARAEAKERPAPPKG
jgi:hypothetical protein